MEWLIQCKIKLREKSKLREINFEKLREFNSNVYESVYSSSFGVFSPFIFFSVRETSASLGSISFQNATFSAWYLLFTLGFTSRTRYSCSCSVNLGHVTGEGPESGGFGDLRERRLVNHIKQDQLSRVSCI